MKTPDKKELIDGISALLKAHEEPYEPGSWENFSKPKKGKRPAAITWLSIAAAIALIITAVPFILKDSNNDAIIVNRKSIPETSPSKEMPTTKATEIPHEEVKLIAKTNKVVKQRNTELKGENRDYQNTNNVETATNNQIASYSDGGNDIDPVNANTSKPIPDKPKPVMENNFMEFLQKETKVAHIKEKKTSKWNFGVELLPTVLQSKVNLGAGITTEFRLSKSFSISSGIAYVALDASKNPGSNAGLNLAPNSPAAGLANYSSNKRLVSTDANISGIDIPLSLTYNLNKKLYTSIGVSYFNVLTEKRNNRYITELEVSRTLKDPETGIMETFQTRLAEENAEASTDAPLEGNSYLGFFNLSIGHKQEVFKQYHIVIEPFLKIPVGKLSNEDLQLSNGGVKLRFTF
ncbi:hypothetical protein [Pedobacter immunditicola]|uniref:hypothetical protein n=1 Tax=Pedobacter immunditicola TaxID=3133440 RepID=UPI00309CF61C